MEYNKDDFMTFPKNAIRTFTGLSFDLADIRPEMICIEDIAHSLAYTNRFGGHTRHPYSVAEHSYEAFKRVAPENRIAALLHDASEAYIGDMPSPFKQMMPEYKEIENRIMEAVALKFGFELPLHPEIKKVDFDLLNEEWQMLVVRDSQFPRVMNPIDAKEAFLHAFKICKYH